MNQMQLRQIRDSLSRYHFDEATAICQQVFEAHPEDYQSGWMLGVILLIEGKIEEANLYWLETIAQHNPNAEPQISKDLTIDLVKFLDQEAAECVLTSRLSDAELIYKKILELFPDHVTSLINLGMIARLTHHYEASLEFLDQALSTGHSSHHAYVEMARAYQGLNQPVEAVEALKHALRIKPDYTPASLLLYEIQMSAAVKWHFSMMNDQQRNLAYQAAIESIVDKNSIVFEIGTGSGLLSLMAARAGANKVITCEASAMIASKAEEIIQKNGCQDKIRVINSFSASLTPDDLGVKPNVIIHEIFGISLIDEGVIPALQHALTTLAQPDVKLIPATATLCAALIESETLRHRLLVDEVCGFDLSSFNEFSWPYTLGDHLQHHSYQWLSGFISLATIDFSQVPFHSFDQIVNFPVTNPGNCHGVCLWFDLNFSGKIVLTSGPKQDDKYKALSWGQTFKLLNPMISVSSNHSLVFRFQLTPNLLSLSYLRRENSSGF